MKNSSVQGLEPASVFHWFEELDAIPRGSGNEQAVSDFLVAFARDHGLNVTQDKANNVLIRKPGTPGYEQSPGVIIQGHMDMVCEKAPGVEHDFMKDPVRLCVEGDTIHADGTTLGADDGIAVAMGMAVLASDDIPHPPLELLVTTSEETGMDGAHALDPQLISGRMLINIDSEEEGILTVSCAGGCTAKITFPAQRISIGTGMALLTLTVKGLRGGHSGIEINKGLGNADKLMARLLNSLDAAFALCALNGGSKHNAIAREAEAVLAVAATDVPRLKEQVAELEAQFRSEFQTSDPDIRLLVGEPEKEYCDAIHPEQAQNLLHFLDVMPNGVQSMSAAMPGLVESSLNLGVIRTEAAEVEVITSIRSSVGSLKENIYRTVSQLARMTGGKMSREADYPEWSYNPDSRLRVLFVSLYQKLFGREPAVNAIHAGLECAIFAEKFNGLMDMISIGPTMTGVHTAQERLSISSVQRTWQYLLEILKSLR